MGRAVLLVAAAQACVVPVTVGYRGPDVLETDAAPEAPDVARCLSNVQCPAEMVCRHAPGCTSLGVCVPEVRCRVDAAIAGDAVALDAPSGDTSSAGDAAALDAPFGDAAASDVVVRDIAPPPDSGEGSNLYCACDGTTFVETSPCVRQPYAYAGACRAAGSAPDR